MRHSAPSSNVPLTTPRLKELIFKQFGAFVGLFILLAVIFCAVSLASWNAADPSFSYANNNAVTNLAGPLGAIFADLAMQFLGLASVAALLPPFYWGLLMLFQKPIGRFGKRCLAWLGSVLCFGALASLVPLPQGWPIPIGLGGVLGDMSVHFMHVFSGFMPAAFEQIILIVLLIPLGLVLMAYACSIIFAGPRPVKHQAQSDYEDQFDDLSDDDDAPIGWTTRVFGTISHMVLYVYAFLRRLVPWKKTARKDDFDLGADDYNALYVEPSFDDMPAHIPEQDDEVAPKKRRKPKTATAQATPKYASSGFQLPDINLLAAPKAAMKDPSLNEDILAQNAAQLEHVLEDFGVKGRIINVKPGPVVTLYELEPAPGIKSSRIIGLADDIARSMSAISARVAVVPGRNVIGIELPNNTRQTVYLRELIDSNDFMTNKAHLALALGKTIGGEAVIADLAKMPHMLVAGTTGSGKSVAINTMILSLLYRMSPEQCRLIMVDPKMLELSIYDGIPHLLTPVVTDPKKAVVALKWAVREMEERYRKMSKMGVRNIDGFNQRIAQAQARGETLMRTIQVGFDKETGQAIYENEPLEFEPMPYIVVIIDEMADLMMVAGKEIEAAVQRLAQMARASGIHVIMATQRPSVDVITGTIKANFPTRVSFSVTSKIDSRTILGEQGAEQLLGQGDMLFMMGGGRIRRVHGPFVGDDEVEHIVSHLKAQGVPQYLDAVTEEDESDSDGSLQSGGSLEASDDPYDQAVAVVLRDRKVSTSYIQRRLGIGYNRAASIVERMEEEGLISPANHAGKREILVPEQEEIF